MASQRLLTLCAAALGVLLLCVVPYRMEMGGRSWIRYDFAWERPYSPKGKHDSNSPVCPDGGPYVPALLLEFAALTLGTMILRDRLGRGDEAKLEGYPGYRGA